jgi:hypothetical protein
MKEEAFSIPHRSESGSEWESFSFEQWGTRMQSEGKPYKIKPLLYLRSVKREFTDKLGVKKGKQLFYKAILWDLIFKKPRWAPEKFNFSSKRQEMFYRKKFQENLPVVVLFNALKRVIGEKEADKIMANTMVPVALNMMKTKYHPVENIDSVEVWFTQARSYLGEEVEKDKGFDGTVYLAEDKSELKLHVTRCINIEVLRAYGLFFTAKALCMCDHITYHTIFPNLTFKRSHTIAIGDKFCDHEFRVKQSMKPHDEDDYTDCNRSGIREYVREWEDKAKEMMFGSREEWEKYVVRCFSGKHL